MSEPWYWKLGFSANPFNIKPAALNNEVVGHRLGPILEKIENGMVQFIEAPLGSGKTTILKNIISTFGGAKKLIYCSCIKNESLNVNELLKNATLRGKLFGTMPQDMIIMVDEAQNISKDDAEEITDFKEYGNIKSVAFFGLEYDKKLLTEGLNKSLNGNVTVLSYLTPQEAVELVRTRIGNLKLLPDYVIREIYGRTNGNSRRFLQYCEEICKKAVDLSINELTITDVETLLKPSEAPRKKRVKKTVQVKVKKRVQRKKTKKEGNKIKEPAATVTYSGYSLENIRSYEEEMGMTKREEE